MGLFDQFVGGAPPTEEDLGRPAPAAPPVAPPDLFGRFVGGQAPTRVISPSGKAIGAPGQPFGELSERQPQSWTDWLKEKGQDILMAGGAEPYKARHIAGGGVDAAKSVSPMGSILSAADLPGHLGRGQFGEAAWDAVGAIPFFGGAARAARGAPQISQIRPAFEPPPWAPYRGQGGTLLSGRVESPGEVAAINAGGRSWVTPSTGELSGRGVPGDPIRGVAQEGYEAVRNAPIAFHPATGPHLDARITSHIESNAGGGFNTASAPGVYQTIDHNLAAWQAHGGPVTPSDLMTLRDQLRNLPATQNAPGQAVAGRRAADQVETFMGAPPAGAVMMGTPQDVAAMRTNLANARGNYRAGETAETVELGIDRSGTKAGTTYSGLNVGNKTRQQMEALAGRNPVTKEVKLFGATPEELTAVLGASQPGWLENQQRLWGNRLGGGGGLGQAVTTGGLGGAAATVAHMMGMDPVTSGAIGLATMGASAKAGSSLVRASNERAVQGAEEAAALIRRNSPEFRARAALSPEVSDPRGMMRDAMAYALMPKAADAGRDWWEQQYVPYTNR